MTNVFLDTNVLLRHLQQDHSEHSPRATSFISRLEGRVIRARITGTVIFETVFLLEKSYRESRSRIRDVMLELMDLPGLTIPDEWRIKRAFDLYVDHNVSFADAYHVAATE